MVHRYRYAVESFCGLAASSSRGPSLPEKSEAPSRFHLADSATERLAKGPDFADGLTD
jgi:hypothetical protein